MSTFAISDIHGAHRALVQVLERSGFSDSDTLIFCGDVCDGWREVYECIKTLSGIKNFVGLVGNHDNWAYRWMIDDVFIGGERDCWTSQGGMATIKSCIDHKEECVKFLEGLNYYHELGDKLFVHGGIALKSKASDNSRQDIIWDREMVKEARYVLFSSTPVVEEYGEVFCGHNPTINLGSTVPLNYSNVWMIDTGASYSGPLTMIDVHSKEFWQSDPVTDLYPCEFAR